MMRRLILCLLCPLSLLAADTLTPEAAARRIASAYGIDGFRQVIEMSFTFNVQLPDKTIARHWIWRPREGRVTRADGNGVVSYLRRNLADQAELREVDAQFINDQYWLLFPFHLVWDEEATLTLSDGPEALPLGEGEARRLTIQYPDTGGYTPGDAYDLYFDDAFLLVEWAYRKGGAKAPTRSSTWAVHQAFGPILISLDHRGADHFRVWFTDVTVTVDED